MDYFLENIASSLHREFGNTLNRHCLVFPSRRAGLYFLKYLSSKIDKPVWAPSTLTINELFRSNSSLQIAGNEILLFELYKIYSSLKKLPESFDDFYFWGDMLLSDFDDIDKYLVDASLLFRNVLDIKNIDQQFGGFTESQAEVVRRFWTNFDPVKPTNEKTGFISIWSVLADMYSSFRSSLKEKNLAYEGMVFRELAENLDTGIRNLSQWDMIHFIGFNALNECEKVIMKGFKKERKARFYWDYDNSYLKEDNLNSAGFFLRDNLRVFGNDMDPDWKFNTMLSSSPNDVRRCVIEVSSDVAQVKLISQLISELPGLNPENAHHTAVVLADENLLMPVLTSLPENISDINITMGYPLKQSLVYTLIKQLMDLQSGSFVADGAVLFSFRIVHSIFKHPLMEGILTEADFNLLDELKIANPQWVNPVRFNNTENLSRIFRRPDTPELLSDYFRDILSLLALKFNDSEVEIRNKSVQRNIWNEFIYRIVLSINRLESIVKSPEIKFTSQTYIRILDRMLRMQSVPFSGEPLSGIQIMGILETRALDFKNLIILSVNEGILPAVSSGSSFIPFSLREAFGLPSINHQESIFAYHFYRLLQRAENVTFTYNSNSDGLRSGEMSRFLTQMKYNESLKPDFFDLNFEIKSHSTLGNVIERNDKHVNELGNRYLEGEKTAILSPSAINTWLSCRMKFFYQYVNNLKEPDIPASEIDPAMVGNFLHEVMKRIYTTYRGEVLSDEILKHILGDNTLLQSIIREVISEIYRDSSSGLVGGNELIIKDIILAYVKRILQADRTISPVTILHLEEKFSFSISTLSDGSSISLRTGGTVDRIDLVSGTIRIVDYKTGMVSEKLGSISELFAADRKKDSDGWLQTLLYCEAYLSAFPNERVRPSVYNVKKMSGNYLSDKLRIVTDRKSEYELDDYQNVRDEFISGLREVIALIFSKNEPFSMTTDSGKCSFCPYRNLCLR
jgi:hypothetical protein